MSGPRGSGWDTGLAMFIENEITNDTGKTSYIEEVHKDAVVFCPTHNMAELLTERFKNNHENKYEFTSHNFGNIYITHLGSNDFLGIDTNKIIFHNYTLMKKIPLHKKKLREVENALIPTICSHDKKFIFKIC